VTGPAHRVLEVQDAGVRVGQHQVARHPVAVHRDHRLRQRAVDQQAAGPVPDRALGRAPGEAELALHAPVGEQRQLARQQRLVVGRQRVGRHAQLPANERVQRIAHQAVGQRRVGVTRLAQGVQVEPPAEVAQQQEALRSVALEHTRRVQPGLRDQSGDVHEGAHVLLRRRGVHDDEAGVPALIPALDAQVAPEARVGRGRRQRGRLQRVARADRRQPAFEGGAPVRVGPGDGGGGRRRRDHGVGGRIGIAGIAGRGHG
jgi:hypothetical protein